MRAFAFAALLMAAAPVVAAPTTLSEGFDNITALPGAGWVLTNQSNPTGVTGWFQGNSGVFAANSGAASSYIAANYNNSTPGGTISNWLISPFVSFTAGSTISFVLRGADDPNYFDTLGVYTADGDTTDTADYTQLGATVTAPASGWGQFSFTLTSAFDGRFALRYFGGEPSSNYLGVDDVALTAGAPIDTPEPAMVGLLGLGTLALATRRRRR